MGTQELTAAMRRVEQLLLRRPSAGAHADAPAIARWAGGARMIVAGDRSELVTDLPPELGGEAAGPSPGWLMRAGLASCMASSIAVLAARENVTLDHLEVEAGSRSDLRGIFGIEETGTAVDPGPSDLVLRVRITAAGLSAERLKTLVEAAYAMSPVPAALQIARPIALDVETGG
jgi:uncharacterized OsmC-like protein